MPRIGLGAVVIGVRRAASGIFGDKDAAIVERNIFALKNSESSLVGR